MPLARAAGRAPVGSLREPVPPARLLWGRGGGGGGGESSAESLPLRSHCLDNSFHRKKKKKKEKCLAQGVHLPRHRVLLCFVVLPLERLKGKIPGVWATLLSTPALYLPSSICEKPTLPFHLQGFPRLSYQPRGSPAAGVRATPVLTDSCSSWKRKMKLLDWESSSPWPKSPRLSRNYFLRGSVVV